jgi:DNA-binding GntR family transcriptional regulator
MNVHLNRSRLLRLVSDRHWSHLYEQHDTMFGAVKAGDADLAERAMREHLQLGVARPGAL